METYLTHLFASFQHRVDKDRHVSPHVFDIPIEIEDPLKSKMHAAVAMLDGNGSTTGTGGGTEMKGGLKEVMEMEDEVS